MRVNSAAISASVAFGLPRLNEAASSAARMLDGFRFLPCLCAASSSIEGAMPSRTSVLTLRTSLSRVGRLLAWQRRIHRHHHSIPSLRGPEVRYQGQEVRGMRDKPH